MPLEGDLGKQFYLSELAFLKVKKTFCYVTSFTIWFYMGQVCRKNLVILVVSEHFSAIYLLICKRSNKSSLSINAHVASIINVS